MEVQPAPGPFEVKAAAEEWFSAGDASRTEIPERNPNYRKGLTGDARK